MLFHIQLVSMGPNKQRTRGFSSMFITTVFCYFMSSHMRFKKPNNSWAFLLNMIKHLYGDYSQHNHEDAYSKS